MPPAAPPPRSPLVLVTRAADEAAETVAALAAEGIRAIPAPCLVYAVETVDEAWFAQRAAAPVQLLVTSPRSIPALRAVSLPPTWRVLALAPTTARALEGAGLRVDAAVTGGGAALAAAATPGPVILATSDLGGAEVLTVRPDAERWITYRTLAPAGLPDDARAALDAEYDLVAASPSALANLDALHPGAVARARRVLAHGGTTVDAARRLSARDVVPWRLGTPFPR